MRLLATASPKGHVPLVKGITDREVTRANAPLFVMEEIVCGDYSCATSSAWVAPGPFHVTASIDRASK